MIRWLQRARSVLAVGASLALALTGCIKVEQTLSLDANGSGTIEFTYGMAEASLAQMKAMTESMMAEGEEGDADTMPFAFDEEDVREQFKEYEPDGVTLLSVKQETRDGWKYTRMKVRFETLAGLGQTGFLADRGFSLLKNAEGNYVFTQAASGNGNEGMPDTDDPTVNAAMAEMMKGFRVVVRVQTPSRILETNAPDKTDRSAAWVFDLEEDAQTLKKMQNARLRIVFEGKGLTIPEFRNAAASAR